VIIRKIILSPYAPLIIFVYLQIKNINHLTVHTNGSEIIYGTTFKKIISFPVEDTTDQIHCHQTYLNNNKA
jgi:hypothetical protein